MTLAQKLNPNRFTDMSAKMAAIVGFVLGENWTNPTITDMHITSDGYVLAQQQGDLGMNEFIGSVDDLERNWYNLLEAAELSTDEKRRATVLFRTRITDWRHDIPSFEVVE